MAEEIQHGAVSTNKIRWLISCKHLFASGRSVGETDEQNITDRLAQHSAQGFLGFYSTLASSGLGNRLDAIREHEKYNVEIFDGRRIEEAIISDKHYKLFKRYFPASYSQWVNANKEPTLLMSTYQPLPCAVCGHDLLSKGSNGIIVFSKKIYGDQYENVVGVCRGECDHKYSRQLREQGYGTAWEDINDFIIPTIYLQKQMAIINSLYYKKGDFSFTDRGIEAYKAVLIALSQLVLRKQTDAELKRAISLSELPDGI